MKKATIKVLIVEDDPKNVELLKEMLRDEFDVQTVMTGGGALDKVNTFHPNIILLDVMLPQMDGIEICKQIRKDPKFHATKIIIQSARAFKKEKELGYSAGADDYIEVPYNQHILLARLKAKTRRKTAENTIQEISFANISDIDINDHNHIQFGKWLYQPRGRRDSG